MSSDDYSYRDARLSIWQAAVGDHARKHKSKLAASSTPSTQASTQDLMLPVHMVANAVKSVGKPLDWLFHELKKGVLDLKSRFDPLEDCANAAAHFLWAELEGDKANSDLYAGELGKSVCDVAGWTECLTSYLAYKALLEKPMYRPNQGSVVELEKSTRIAIIGDWGTGDDVAKNVLKEVAKLEPDVLIHLGDVYYAATTSEVKANFLDIVRSTLGDIPVFTLCGNHDMYSGGAGYYWLLDQIGQKASYFRLQNDNWVFMAMDTGFHDNNPFNVSTNMTGLVRQDGWSEADWHLQQIADAGNRKLVMLSHHQLFSPFGSVGAVDGKPYAYNPNVYGTFKDILPKVQCWFWGHEHTLGVFPSYMGLSKGRCVGASAVPVFHDQQSYATADGLQTLDGMPMPQWDKDRILGFTGNMYNNCFAMMTLNGTAATVEYYEVPLLKPAVKFSTVDQL